MVSTLSEKVFAEVFVYFIVLIKMALGRLSSPPDSLVFHLKIFSLSRSGVLFI